MLAVFLPKLLLPELDDGCLPVLLASFFETALQPLKKKNTMIQIIMVPAPDATAIITILIKSSFLSLPPLFPLLLSGSFTSVGLAVATTGARVGTGVGLTVGAYVASGVMGARVGAGVGTRVGEGVVGLGVGESVGAPVGAFVVARAVGAAVGFVVGAGV